jgi:oxygen-dependent protoporphyrinogen oxidase
VTLGFEKDDVSHDCAGFGFLAPRVSGLRTLGAIFPSGLFAGRAPEGWHSFTCFMGGATDPGAVELDDDALVAQVTEDLGRTVGARGEPKVLSITRWARAIPQYTIGHVARVAEIERDAAASGIRLLGNFLHGVSVGECIAAATKATT